MGLQPKIQFSGINTANTFYLVICALTDVSYSVGQQLLLSAVTIICAPNVACHTCQATGFEFVTSHMTFQKRWNETRE